MFDVEPTGQDIELTVIEMDRFEDAIETWTQSYQFGRMHQLESDSKEI